MPNGYSKTQIRLHWAIFILILFQYILHDPIVEAWKTIQQGGNPEPNILVLQHVIGGIAVFALVLWRLRLRTTRGVPALPEEEPPMQKMLAHGTHWVLYGLMILLPISGAVAFFGQVELAATAHSVMRLLMLLFLLLHIIGALYQQFVLKTNILDRMKIPDQV